jgi:hypothetical protein
LPADRKPFLLRLDPKVLHALQRWARDDLRSLNAQLEFLLRGLLVRAGRLPGDANVAAGGPRAPEPGDAAPPSPRDPDPSGK